MHNYNYLKDFDEFHLINESLNGLIDDFQDVCNQAFIDGGPIIFSNGESVDPETIIDICDEAISYLGVNYRRTLTPILNRIHIIFLRESSEYETMAVDNELNMYINASFVYSLKEPKYVAAIIMHEVFHVFYDHIKRGSNWVAAQGKALTRQLHHDNNLAADVEVNQTLVKLGIITEDDLTNVIHGLYLKNSERTGSSTDIVPMESILGNKEYMDELRRMAPLPVNPEKIEVKTTEKWNEGYKAGWNKIASLINEHGYEEAWDILFKAGIVNILGEINMKKDIDDIKSLKFLQVKSYEDFINESFNDYETDMGQTYENGFITGMSKIISKLYSAKFPKKGMNGGGGGPILDTELTPNDLDQVNLPLPETDETDGGENKKGAPENVNNTNKNKKSDKSQENKNNSEGQGQQSFGQGEGDEQQSSGQGRGGKGQGQQSSGQGEGDEQQSSGQGRGGKGQGKGGKGKSINNDSNSSDDELSGIGGTGSFINDDMIDKVLKKSGYKDEHIDEIKKMIEKNKKKNTPSAIEKAKQEMRKNIKNGYVCNLMNKIKVESSKYENIWKDIMEDFLKEKSRNAGKKINGSNDWLNPKGIANGRLKIRHKKVAQDPQDLNVYVDVSGSVNTKLLEVIGKSLVVFSKEFEYSGINICPWASESGEIGIVDDFSECDEDEVTKEILKIISNGAANCGGGTNEKAVIASMVTIIVKTLNDPDKENKDDVHVVITDGQIPDRRGIEEKIKKYVYDSVYEEKEDISLAETVAETAPEHTFWMIYDADESLMNDWKNIIKKGKLIFINSKTVTANK